MRKAALLALSLVGAACAAVPPEEAAPNAADGDGVCEDAESLTRDPVNHKASLCEYACAIATTLECGYVQTICVAGSVISVGGVTIPCAAAALATCAASAAGAIACIDLCKGG